MAKINPSLVPYISPGHLFERFTTDNTLNIRWMESKDPCFYEAFNRCFADIALRQLIVAKAVDNLSLRLAFMSMFPFLIPPQVEIGTSSDLIGIPLSWIWDMHISIPASWLYLRLAKIKRMSGQNIIHSDGSKTFTGVLRLVFTAQVATSSAEVALFALDYHIDSTLTYQFAPANVTVLTPDDNPIDPSLAETIAGYAIFRTLTPATDPNAADFFTMLAPPSGGTETSSGWYVNPTVYPLADAEPASSYPDTFTPITISHGTGTLVTSAYNSIPSTESDFNSWLAASNYPFRLGASRTSLDGIIIPKALFSEFNIVAPSPDQPTGDRSKLNSPVWISSIERVDVAGTQLLVTFSTYTIQTTTPIIVEFATMLLQSSMQSGTVVAITPITNILGATGGDADNFLQGFGTGYAVLSNLWSGSVNNDVQDFFNAFLAIVTTPAVTSFTQAATLVSSYGVSRVPVWTPTQGQSAALRGTTARLTTPVNPSDTNRYVTEADQGLGNTVDFRTIPGITDNPDIQPIAYTGSLAHKCFTLIVDANGANHDYTKDVLPRMQCLLGRSPQFADIYYDGTYFKIFNGDAWISL